MGHMVKVSMCPSCTRHEPNLAGHIAMVWYSRKLSKFKITPRDACVVTAYAVARDVISMDLASVPCCHAACSACTYPDTPITIAGLNAPSLTKNQLSFVPLSSASSRNSWLYIGNRETLRTFSTGFAIAKTSNYNRKGKSIKHASFNIYKYTTPKVCLLL